jgi:sporulation protein YlmC with PRC-barrel domain
VVGRSTPPPAEGDTAATTEPAMTQPDTAETATAETTDSATTDTATMETAEAPAVEPAAGSDTEMQSATETQVAAADAAVTAEQLIGKTVVNANNETIGEIEDLVIDDQKVIQAVVSVGGFLGIGDKDVAVPTEQLQLSEDKAMLNSTLTKEDLEKMPAFQEGSLKPLDRTEKIY